MRPYISTRSQVSACCSIDPVAWGGIGEGVQPHPALREAAWARQCPQTTGRQAVDSPTPLQGVSRGVERFPSAVVPKIG